MVPSVGTEAQSLRTTEETIQPNNKATISFGSFVSLVMTVPAIRPRKGREAVGLDHGGYSLILLVFSVMPFKIDQNKNQTVQQIKSRIWEMKVPTCTKTFARFRSEEYFLYEISVEMFYPNL